MSGLCGWIGSMSADACAGEHIAGMAASIHRFGGGSKVLRHGDNWALAVAGSAANTDIFVDEHGAVVVYGRVRAAGSVTQSNISADGLARTILALYRSDGAGFLDKLSGGFAIVVILPDSDTVLLATDRLGSVPLSYAISPEGVVFSTNVRALRDSPLRRLSADPQAIYQYLYFHNVPAPYSVYSEAQKMLPSTYLLYRKGRAETSAYGPTTRSVSRPRKSMKELEEEFRSILQDSVARSIEGCESVGCFLSGGTDSSTVVGMLARLQGKQARSYSIGFDEDGYDELEYARLAASHFDIRHQEYYVTSTDVAKLIPQIAAIYGEPFGNSSAVPTFYCAAMAAKDGVERMLGGDGGDEVFGGNVRYAEQQLFGIYDRIPSFLRENIVGPLAKSLPMSFPPTRKVRRYVEQAEISMPLRMYTYNHLSMLGASNVLHPDFAELIDASCPEADLTKVYRDASATNMIDRMLALDMKVTIADNDLPKVTTMCEMADIDVAFPLLDEELLIFAEKLPANQKVRGTMLRVFFKRALKDFLPRQIIRKKKHGFGLPFGKWLVTDNNLRDIVHDALLGLGGRNIVRREFISRLIDQSLHEHSAYYGEFAWVLMQLELWYREHEMAYQPNQGRIQGAL